LKAATQYKIAHAKGTSSKPLLQCTVGDYLKEQVIKYPFKDALKVAHQNNMRWTYKELLVKIKNIGTWISFV
jgi:hypothetical protein